MKKLTSYLAVFAMAIMAVLAVKPAEVKAATTYQDVKVYEVSEMTDFDRQIGLSWRAELNLDTEAGKGSDTLYGKFTLSKDSIVRIKYIIKDQEDEWTKDYWNLYSNEAMISPVIEKGGNDRVLTLKEGTYYIEYKSEIYYGTKSEHAGVFSIGAVACDNAVSVEQTVSADRKKMTIKVRPNYMSFEEVNDIRWAEGKDANNISTEADAQGCFDVDKNGWYSVKIHVGGYLGNAHDYTFNIEVKGIGPGAKKGVTYTVNNVKYKVVKAGFDGTGTVMVTGMKKAKSSLTIPNKVNIGNHDYQVVKINKNAFKKQYKLKKITIKATGIKSIGKNAFKSINSKATLTVPKKSYSQYKKMLTKKTGFVKKTMKIKKK